MSWTEEQKNAIDARGTSLIVSAAAGSGKTAVLTERLVQLIADKEFGVRADRIVVVTFTNDAAAELKKRLENKIRVLISEHPKDRHLLKQQILLQNAKISTINSFCFDLIRDNIGENGITSSFSVLDDTDNKVLKAKALEELINYFSEKEYNKISFLFDRFCIKDEKRLLEVIERTDSFLSSVALRDKWLEKAVKMYTVEFKESDYHKKLVENLRIQIENALKAADENVGLISRIFPDMSVAAAEKSFVQAEEERNLVLGLWKILNCGRLPTEEEASLVYPDLVRVGKTEHNKLLREIYKKKRDYTKKMIAKVANSIKAIESDYYECREVTRVLVDMLKKYNEILWEKKCEKNALSFDDGERLALEMLISMDENGYIMQSEIAKRIADYYDIIMIDEYQDSNNKQDLIFKLISKNYKASSNGEPLYGDNVFLVGDVKQSIYRFRLANPKNFIKTLKSSDRYSSEINSKNMFIMLNKNFRSSYQVIDFVNYLFSQIMSEKCGDIEYTQDEMLNFGAKQYSDCQSADCLTHFAFINDDIEESDDDEEKLKKINNEVIYTTLKISEMLKGGAEVVEKDGKKRPCSPSDFCVLVRNNSYINTYVDELNRIGIPAKGNEETGYLRSREIAVLIDLLRIISNPLQDISMAAVMTSPMYMFSVMDIAVIKSFDRQRALFPIIRGLADGEYPECTDMFLRERCVDFLDSIDNFRLDSVTMTIGELIGEIYDSTDFISVMQLYNDGEKKRANLRALILYAENYESMASYDGSGGLNGFLRHIDRVMENGDYAQGKVSASSGEFVTVQTLHRSKGLEYPFVFIAETSVKFKFDSKSVMCNTDGRIGYVLYDPVIYRKYKTFQQTMLSAEEEKDTRSEEMRLLYVGLTRAQQKLFINMKCGEKALKRAESLIESCVLHNGDIDEAVSEAKSFSDWLWLGIIRDPLFAKIAEQLEINTDEMSFARKSCSKLWDYEIISELKREKAEETDEDYEEILDENLVLRLKDIISYNYDKTLSEMPAKLSVTEITKKLNNSDEVFDFKLKRPRFMSAVNKLTGSERGTAIHTFFQYCNFDKEVSDVDFEIDEVKKKGFISAVEAEAINRDNALAFFKSDLYRRIRNSLHYVREKKFMVAVRELDIEEDIIGMLSNSDGMIRGIIDLMFEEVDGIVILDYKTDKGISLQKMKERYSTQLKLYKSAVELTTGKKVKEAILYSFELCDYIKADI